MRQEVHGYYDRDRMQFVVTTPLGVVHFASQLEAQLYVEKALGMSDPWLTSEWVSEWVRGRKEPVVTAEDMAYVRQSLGLPPEENPA